MREYTIDPFLQTRVEQIMARPVHTLAATTPAKAAIDFFATVEGARRHKSYPVVDDAEKLVGMASRSDVMRWMRDSVAPDAPLADLVDHQTPFTGYSDELVGELADRMATADIGRVPILDRQTEKVVGLVARRDLLRVRAYVIREERERRRLLRMGFHLNGGHARSGRVRSGQAKS
jgi:CBS domain-containing protein